MDLINFLKACCDKLNLHPNFVLKECDPSTVSYIQPFCLYGVEKSIVGYIYVSTYLYSSCEQIMNNKIVVGI